MSNLVACPRCGSESVEEVGVEVVADRDEYEAGNPLGTRGGYVKIDLLCPSDGHGFSFTVANHKGSQFFGVES